jgi:hypothetical protein
MYTVWFGFEKSIQNPIWRFSKKETKQNKKYSICCDFFYHFTVFNFISIDFDFNTLTQKQVIIYDL